MSVQTFHDVLFWYMFKNLTSSNPVLLKLRRLRISFRKFDHRSLLTVPSNKLCYRSRESGDVGDRIAARASYSRTMAELQLHLQLLDDFEPGIRSAADVLDGSV